jgi:4-hydroxy-tetrahydrodipicolinate reductase
MQNERLKIAIVGYGKMGKMIEQVAMAKGIQITNVFDIDAPLDNTQQYAFDVAIDFSTPDVVINNVKTLAELGKNVVIGTTGWYDKIELVKQICSEKNIGCVWASNFSIGMQIMFKLVAQATKLSDANNLYDVFINEIHHRHKKDSPSGTALELAKIVIANSNTKQKILTEVLQREIEFDELHITSSRGGSVTGTHNVYFDSDADTIELTHTAKNRTGFAEGALLAAHWLKNKTDFSNFAELFA